MIVLLLEPEAQELDRRSARGRRLAGWQPRGPLPVFATAQQPAIADQRAPAPAQRLQGGVHEPLEDHQVVIAGEGQRDASEAHRDRRALHPGQMHGVEASLTARVTAARSSCA